MSQFWIVHAQRARAAMDIERWELALEETAKALAEEPQSGFLHALRAEALFRNRDYREARAAAQEALALEPEWSVPYYWLAWSLVGDFFAGPDRLEQAKRVADAAIEVDPDEPISYYLRAEIARFCGQSIEGVAFAETGLSLDPEHTSCLKALASCQLAIEHYAEAEATLRRLLALEPESTFAHENLARVLLGQSQYAGAYEHARSAIRMEPDDADIRDLYRETVRFQNRPARALLWMSKIWDRYPYFVVVLWLIPVVALCGFTPVEDTLRGVFVLMWSLVFVFHERLATSLAEWFIAHSHQRHLLPDLPRRYSLDDWVRLGLIGLVLGLLVVTVVFCLVLVNDQR